MKTIMKYPLQAQSNVVQKVTMPKGYRILTVENLLVYMGYDLVLHVAPNCLALLVMKSHFITE